MPNYYEILGCCTNTSYEEMKRRYHELIMKCHPDKTENNENGTATFQEIDEAWKTLRDPSKKKAYDESLRHRRLEEQSLLFGNFTLSDLDYDPETKMYSCSCKCGGTYSFTREGSEGFNSCLISCEQCSLLISVDFQ